MARLSPNGGGGLTLIEGDPGIGKTRLARELSASDVARPVPGDLGSRLGGRPSPVFPLDPGAARAGSRGRIARIAAGTARAPARRRRAICRVVRSTFSGKKRGNASDSHDTLSSWLLAESLRQPILLMLDDLHATSQASLRMLHFLSRQLESMPLYVVGTRRPLLRRGDDGVAETLASLAREGDGIAPRRPRTRPVPGSDYRDPRATPPATRGRPSCTG